MIPKIAVKRPVTMIMVLIAMLSLGLVSMIKLPQALMPNVDYPYAMVTVSYTGGSPQEVDDSITTPIETALASVENIKNIYSYSSEGSSTVYMEFQMNTDMNFALLDVREKISIAQQAFPKNAGTPLVIKANMNSFPIMELFISSENMDLANLSSYIKDNISPKFERLQGVATVDVDGGTAAELKLNFNQSKLQGYGLSLSDINQVLSAENVSIPGGDVKSGDTRMSIRTDGEFKSIDDVKNMPITLSDGTIITIKDIADISEEDSKVETITRVNGERAIKLSMSKASDANIVDVSNAIRKEIKFLKSDLGDKLNFEIGYDDAEFVRTAIKSVRTTAVQGALLAILIIFFFLRNFRSTLVIALSIPASMIATFWVMKMLGMTLNMFTLGALTISIGMVVDNSVVVLENIFRRSKEGLNPKKAAVEGSSEVVLAVMASTLTSIVVYLPVALSGGIVGMMFKDFAYTIIAVLTMSLVVAVTIVPTLSSKLLNNSISEDYFRIGKFFYRYKLVVIFTKAIEAMQEGYVTVAKWMLVRRKRVVAISFIIFILSLGLVKMVGMELMPSVDDGSLVVDVEMPPGTKVEDKDACMSKIEKYCMNLPEKKTVTLSTSSNRGQGSTSTGGEIKVQLVDLDKRHRSTEEVKDDIRKHFSDIAGAKLSYQVGDSSDGGSAIGNPTMQLKIIANDSKTVRTTLVDIEKYIRENSKKVSSVSSDVDSGTPEVILKLDRAAAAKYGISATTLSSTLTDALTGIQATKINIDGKDINIKLQMDESYGNSLENMNAITINTTSGEKVPVGQIAEISYDISPETIMKENQKVQSTIEVKFASEVNIKDGEAEINALMDKYIMPQGVSLDKGGTVKQMDESFKMLIIALLLSILLVYVVLASQFESFILPIMIMMSIPFAMSGSFLALFLTGTKLSMVSIVALIMLIGMVVNNAILLVEFINQNKDKMERDEAIAKAGSVRLRPILMTTLTTIIGMLPMAIGVGEGAKTMAPMAIAMIGGMIASTLITLFLIPILYAMVDDKERKLGIKREYKKRLRLYEEALWLATSAEAREKKRLAKIERRKAKREGKLNKNHTK